MPSVQQKPTLLWCISGSATKIKTEEAGDDRGRNEEEAKELGGEEVEEENEEEEQWDSS